MENAIKTLETTLAERNAMVRILQSKSNLGNLTSGLGVGTTGTNVNNLNSLNIDDIVSSVASVNAAGAATPKMMENILSIPVHHGSPHKKQFSTPSMLAATPSGMSLPGQVKKLHAHRSLTPSADMFLQRGSAAQVAVQDQILRSATPSADFLRAAATPSHLQPPVAAQNAIEAALRASATPTMPTASAELMSRVSQADFMRMSQADIIRSQAELLARTTPLSAIPTSSAASMMSMNNMNMPVSSAASSMIATSMSSMPPTVTSLTSVTGLDSMNTKRREPSGHAGETAYHHPGST